MSENKVNNIRKFVQKVCQWSETLISNGAEKNEILLFRGQ